MSEKNNLDKYTGILFELKIGLNKDNAIVIIFVNLVIIIPRYLKRLN